VLQHSIVATQPNGEVSILYPNGLALVVKGQAAEWRYRGVRIGRVRPFLA